MDCGFILLKKAVYFVLGRGRENRAKPHENGVWMMSELCQLFRDCPQTSRVLGNFGEKIHQFSKSSQSVLKMF